VPTFRRQYVFPKSWHLPTSLHDAKTHKNIIIIIIIILTAAKTSNLMSAYLLDMNTERNFVWQCQAIVTKLGTVGSVSASGTNLHECTLVSY
jgi:hypothetical protein